MSPWAPIQPFPHLTLVTGPSRSGKSEWAEYLAQQSGRTVTYVATAQLDPTDGEWQERIIQHQRRRPADWKTLTVPVDLATCIQQANDADCLLIDSLGTWLANVLDQDDGTWQDTLDQLLIQFSQAACPVIVVAEETGWGLVPAYPLGRCFRDRLGQLVRRIGAIAHPVYLVTGGHVLNLSQLGMVLPGDSVP